MTSVIQPQWIRFSEKAFSLNFVAFSFVMFSCLFPTGFSATFSTVAFIFALPLFFSRANWINISLYEKAGLVLLGWLFLSIFWSQASLLDSLGYLSEYRFYFMVPVFAAALLYLPNTQKLAFYAAVAGAVVALLASYGLGLGWWEFEGAYLSLADSIYHGFIMSAFLLGALLVARNATGLLRVGAFLLAALIMYNVLNIETGRTGYLQVVAVSFVIIVLSFSRLQAAILTVAAAASFGIGYFWLDQFNVSVDQTVLSVERMVKNSDYDSSSGYRLEFYRGAIQIGADNPVSGVGLGDVVDELESRFNSGQIRVLTNNVHSEFLNMLIAGGMPASLLFLAFVLLIAWEGYQYRKRDRVVGDALIGTAAIVFVSALFNSTIKDYGEKHALLIILSVLAARLLADRINPVKNSIPGP